MAKAHVVAFPYTALQLKRLAGKGVAEAQYLLAMRHLEGRDVQRSGRMAYAWFSNAANQAFAPAYIQLGALRAYGSSVFVDIDADTKEAIYWFSKARAEGYVDATYNLAMIYFAGKGITTDEPLACRLLHEAGEKRHLGAMRVLCDAYSEGMLGLVPNGRIARLWSERLLAAEHPNQAKPPK